MKSGPDFEQGADAAVNVDAADRRLGNSIQYLEECAFARAIAADNPEHFAGFDIKRNILERPKRFRCRSSIACQTLSQASRQSRKFIVESLVAAQTLVRDAERLTQILNVIQSMFGVSALWPSTHQRKPSTKPTTGFSAKIVCQRDESIMLVG